ncbi:hypothetical protein PM082_014648 [Marasmius tenuissimus]|nr:hypothetical protein PM082_014648 [Marasmius tenuissimus]
MTCVLLTRRLTKQTYPSTAPPIRDIELEEIFQNPKPAYESVLRDSKGVVGVRRKGRLEYIVDRSFTYEVLTDDSNFNFERGTLAIINMQFFLWLKRRFVPEMDTFVHTAITARLPEVMKTVVPIFQDHVDALADELPSDRKLYPIDFKAFVHRTVSSAMIVLILGREYLSEDNIKRIQVLAMGIADLSGFSQNVSWFGRTFPNAWRIVLWLQFFVFTLPVNFLRIAVPVFSQLGQIDIEDKDDKGASNKPIAFAWAERYVDIQSSQIGLADRLWTLVLILGMVFASVHQTAVLMVWIAFELAKRPEDVERIRKEMDREGTSLTYSSLCRFEYLDSFIREVMRTKGETLMLVRMTTTEVPLAGYVLPAGSFVLPLVSLSNLSELYHGKTAQEFVGDRWVGENKPATMVSASHLPFGLGRWACPGRNLAVAEIKALILLLLQRFDLTLEGGNYDVPDPLNVTSVAPQGTLLLRAHR